MKSVIDGDLCEQYNLLDAEKKKSVAEELDRQPSELAKKLEDIRTRYAFWGQKQKKKKQHDFPLRINSIFYNFSRFSVINFVSGTYSHFFQNNKITRIHKYIIEILEESKRTREINHKKLRLQQQLCSQITFMFQLQKYFKTLITECTVD